MLPRDCNKEDLHKKPLLLFLKVILMCMHVVFTCVCVSTCACSPAAVWVCRSMSISWDFAGPLTDSLTFSRTYPSGFASILHSEWISFLEWFLPPLKCVDGAAWPNVTTEAIWQKKLQDAQSWKNWTWSGKTPLPKMNLQHLLITQTGWTSWLLKEQKVFLSVFWDVDG